MRGVRRAQRRQMGVYGQPRPSRPSIRPTKTRPIPCFTLLITDGPPISRREDPSVVWPLATRRCRRIRAAATARARVRTPPVPARPCRTRAPRPVRMPTASLPSLKPSPPTTPPSPRATINRPTASGMGYGEVPATATKLDLNKVCVVLLIPAAGWRADRYAMSGTTRTSQPNTILLRLGVAITVALSLGCAVIGLTLLDSSEACFDAETTAHMRGCAGQVFLMGSCFATLAIPVALRIWGRRAGSTPKLAGRFGICLAGYLLPVVVAVNFGDQPIRQCARPHLPGSPPAAAAAFRVAHPVAISPCPPGPHRGRPASSRLRGLNARLAPPAVVLITNAIQ